LREKGFMSESARPTDADVVAQITAERHLSRFCLVAGRLRGWLKFKMPSGEMWLPLPLTMEDNRLAAVVPGAMLRAGVRSFQSHDEAIAWARTQPGQETLRGSG